MNNRCSPSFLTLSLTLHALAFPFRSRTRPMFRRPNSLFLHYPLLCIFSFWDFQAWSNRSFDSKTSQIRHELPPRDDISVKSGHCPSLCLILQNHFQHSWSLLWHWSDSWRARDREVVGSDQSTADKIGIFSLLIDDLSHTISAYDFITLYAEH